MTATKTQLVNAIVKFIETDLMDFVGDRHMKFVLAMIKDSLKENEDLIDFFFKTPIMASIVSEEDGKYDLTHFFSVLKGVLSEYDSYSITLPKIPLFSPTEKNIKISAEDVDKLIKYLTPISAEATV